MLKSLNYEWFRFPYLDNTARPSRIDVKSGVIDLELARKHLNSFFLLYLFERVKTLKKSRNHRPAFCTVNFVEFLKKKKPRFLGTKYPSPSPPKKLENTFLS